MVVLYNLNYNNLQLACIVIFLLSIVVSFVLQFKMGAFSKEVLKSGKTGAEVARMMLEDFGIYDVEVRQVDGFLSDNYNPLNKTLNLSSEVYNGINVGAAAVAAHECGHAVQHAYGYFFLHLRSLMVPMVAFSSKILIFFLLLGFILINRTLIPLQIGIVLYAAITIFSFITLPVELNASDRAIKWIEDNEIVDEDELKKSKTALRLAAMTYVLAALGSLAELLRLMSIVNGKRED